MSTTPMLNGQILGQAHYATRAVLERELAREALTFHQSLVLNAVATSGGVIERAELADRISGALKIDGSQVVATVTELTGTGLLRELPAGGSGLALTDAGRALQHRLAGTVAGITARLYADLPADDMAVAARVLTLLKRRADADLAASRD